MQIDAGKCIGCGRCRSFCTMGVIHFKRNNKGTKVHCYVDEEECVDCGSCLRAGVCPVEALNQPVHDWPRSVRGTFSNPTTEHKETKIAGRGTEEMKTNDVTNRFKRGFAGIAAELGRPGTGARLRDAERVFKALAPLGVEFESNNPLTKLLLNPKTGDMNPDVLNEKVMSAIVEMIVPLEQVIPVMDTLERVANEIDSLFTVDLAARVNEDLSVPTAAIMKENNKWFSFIAKTNMGLGRLQVKGGKSQ